ncbi:amidase [Verticiella sediminum]|uniref:Amidase n=1 Tax=Verticiella sediminum TaxID=1247510 RepID=A0A556ABM9_9BURK|nr:amidase [Verticiella sediminum]TSH90288.1 amidase [Verticiella sediminum]
MDCHQIPPHRSTARHIRKLLDRGSIDAVDLVECFFSRLTEVNPYINAVVAADRDLALRQAIESNRRRRDGACLSPIDGLPVTVKDNLYIADLPATWGSRAFAGWYPGTDDLSVQRLRRAGANIFAKTNTPEFALAATTHNDLFGTTRNPWDLDLTPGGSSGGAAAAVAAGLGVLAIGTDAGGSIRRPASYTGTVGFRPSTGRIPRIAGFPALAFDLQVVAPCARTVDDAYDLFRIMAGPDRRDRTSMSFTDYPLPESIPALNRPLKILHMTGVPGKRVDAPIVAELHAAAERLRRNGHRVECAEAPYRIEEIERVWSVFTKVGVARFWNDHADRQNLLTQAARSMAIQGGQISGVDYLDAVRICTKLREDFCRFFEQFDAILSPASAAMPWQAEAAYPVVIDGQPAGPRDAAIFATFVNVAGLPSISVPAPVGSGGLPIGIQLTAAYGADVLLLQLARQLESPFAFPEDCWKENQGRSN